MIHSDLPFVFSRRLLGNEIRRGDAADVWSILHSQIFWWRQTVLVCLLRVRQDHAKGGDTRFLAELSATME